MKTSTLALLLIATISTEFALAKRPGPPPEALTACANQTTGAQCSFTGRRGNTLTGQCTTTPKGEMACKPEGKRPRGGRSRSSRQQDSASES